MDFFLLYNFILIFAFWIFIFMTFLNSANIFYIYPNYQRGRNANFVLKYFFIKKLREVDKSKLVWVYLGQKI